MSGASEWAKAEHAVASLWAHLSRLEMRLRTSAVDGAEEYNFCASVGRINDTPTLCFTDYRLGSVVMNDHQALALARWILDKFGEAQG